MPTYGLGNAVGSVGAEGDFGAVDGFQAPPVCTVQPVVSGSAALGSTLTTTDGTFVGTGLGAASRQWYRGAASPISGQTATTYVTAAADYGLGVYCVVTRANAVGSASGTSNAITVTATAPVNTVAGVLSGSSAPGATLTCTSGTWTGSPTITFVYQFYLDGVADGSAGANTRVNQVGDVGKTVTCKPIGTNIVSTVTGTASNGILVAPVVYATWDPAALADHTLSNGNLTDTIVGTNGNWKASSSFQTSGVYIVQILHSTVAANPELYIGARRSAGNYACLIIVNGNTRVYLTGVGQGSPVANFTSGEYSYHVIDLNAGTYTVYRDALTVIGGTYALPTWVAAQSWAMMVSADFGDTEVVTANFGSSALTADGQAIALATGATGWPA